MQPASSFVRLLRVVSLACAVVLLVSAAVRALLHLRDLSGIGHIAGIWMALAQYGDAGILYPPLEANGTYAGTRYMPLCFGLIVGLVRLVGDYVVAAKLMALGSMAALLAGVFVAVRRSTGRTLDAVVLTGLVLASPEGMAALLSPHADALAAALAVAGLLPIERGEVSAKRSCLAALLFTAALMTKFSAVAAPAAAIVFLLRRHRKVALVLLVGWAILTAGGLALLEYVSEGRFLDNFRSLGSGGMSLDSIRIGPARVAFALSQSLPFAVVLALAVCALFRTNPMASGGRKPPDASEKSGGLRPPLAMMLESFGLWDWYFLAAAAVTVVIFTSPGTGFNHLLELEVAAALALARLLTLKTGIRASLVWPIVLAVLLGGGYQFFRNGADDVSGQVVIEALPEGASVLAEDATVSVLLGRRPVVMDAFAFRVLAERGRVDDRELAGRVARREFDVLVLLGRVDRPDASLCPRFHFGPRVTTAMQQAYRFDRRLGPYFLFVPAWE